MNPHFRIAWRYFRGRSGSNAITILSRISTIGIAVGTMGLVVVLSVFNGFESLIVSLYDTFDSPLRITLNEGKFFDASQFPTDKVKELPGVVNYTEVLEEYALLRYDDKQYFATIKGVGENFNTLAGVDSMVIEGRMLLKAGNIDYMVLGVAIADALGVTLKDPFKTIDIYVPRNEEPSILNPERSFKQLQILPSGIFAIQQDFDSKYVLVPLRFARQMLEADDKLSAVELGIAEGADDEEVKQEVQKILGPAYSVKTRLEQHDFLYKIMKSEKWAVYLILTFILLIATFNLVGSLSMLILEKKRDIKILSALGLDNKGIRKVFTSVGLLIAAQGAILGIILGAGICLLQQYYGLISMGGQSFVVDAYPVHIQALDMLYVLLTVMVIGFLSSILPARVLIKEG